MPTSEALAPIDAFLAHDDPINHVAYSPNGKLMATSDTAMLIRVWLGIEKVFELNTKSILEKVRPTERIRGLQFSPDSQKLCIAAGEQLACYDLHSATVEPEWVYIAPRLFAFLIVSPTSLSVSDQGSLAAAFDNGTIAIWNPEGVRQTIIRNNAAPRQLAYLPDETLIGTDSFSLSLWKADQRKPVWHRPTSERIYGMASSSDGKYVAARRLYQTDIYEVSDGSHVTAHKQGRGLPLVAFAPGIHALAIGTQHAIDIFGVPESTHSRLILEDAELISLSFSPGADRVAAGCSDGRVRTWLGPSPEDA